MKPMDQPVLDCGYPRDKMLFLPLVKVVELCIRTEYN